MKLISSRFQHEFIYQHTHVQDNIFCQNNTSKIYFGLNVNSASSPLSAIVVAGTKVARAGPTRGEALHLRGRDVACGPQRILFIDLMLLNGKSLTRRVGVVELRRPPAFGRQNGQVKT